MTQGMTITEERYALVKEDGTIVEKFFRKYIEKNMIPYYRKLVGENVYLKELNSSNIKNQTT